jgi:hypothetical protein
VYVKENSISINSIAPVVHMSANAVNFNGLMISVSNNAGHTENISYFVINRYPPQDGVFLSKKLGGIPAHSTMNYTLNYSVGPVTNTTYIYVMAFSTDYIVEKQVTITNAP